VNHHGPHFDVENARLFDLPDAPPPIGVAVSGEYSCDIAGRLADLMIAAEPKSELVESFERHGGSGKPKVGQLPVCYDRDMDAAVRRAHHQFRWALGGWQVNSELPGPASFDAATQYTRPEDVAETIPCGDSVDTFTGAVRRYVTAGFTEIALVQVGGDHQLPFLDWAEKKLLPALKDL
jgi:G6PDH family F420-dependent oxidoreductase